MSFEVYKKFIRDFLLAVKIKTNVKCLNYWPFDSINTMSVVHSLYLLMN